MSLIEEALRRAQEDGQLSQRETPIHVQLPDPAPAAESAQEASRPSLNWAAAITVATVGVLAWIAWGRMAAPPARRGTSSVGSPATADTSSPERILPARSAAGMVPPRSAAPVVSRQPSQAVRAPVAAEGASHPMVRRAFSPALTLNGVVEGSGEPLALINDNVLRIGDTIEGATLVAVKADAATLRWRDQELVLKTTK